MTSVSFFFFFLSALFLTHGTATFAVDEETGVIYYKNEDDEDVTKFKLTDERKERASKKQAKNMERDIKARQKHSKVREARRNTENQKTTRFLTPSILCMPVRRVLGGQEAGLERGQPEP